MSAITKSNVKWIHPNAIITSIEPTMQVCAEHETLRVAHKKICFSVVVNDNFLMNHQYDMTI